MLMGVWQALVDVMRLRFEICKGSRADDVDDFEETVGVQWSV